MTCQNPLLASKFENNLPLDNCESISLTLSNEYNSLWTPLLSMVKSAHILIFPLLLGYIVRPEHHSVGSSTGSMTLKSSILSNFCFTFSFKPAAIGLCAHKQYGLTFSFKVILA